MEQIAKTPSASANALEEACEAQATSDAFAPGSLGALAPSWWVYGSDDENTAGGTAPDVESAVSGAAPDGESAAGSTAPGGKNTSSDITPDDEPEPWLTSDEALERFLTWVDERGIEPWPHQEDALMNLAVGDHVILGTPTGSGKSLVAQGMCFLALATGRRAYYTAPIKALVSEKFFNMVDIFGRDNVGMITGDSTINTDAPIICCTAEILANQALREGEDADVGCVVMDEFHYYGEPDRGWAWQVPLLTLPRTQFLLMSATLGDVTSIARSLEERTGTPVDVVADAPRPVPLAYEYALTPIEGAVELALRRGEAPLYVVHFSQDAAIATAQALASYGVATKDQRGRIKDAMRHVSFTTAFGKTLKRLLECGVGVHHAGMLPRYRLLVEKLAQQGLLPVICGTDTLGVGINVPIHTVLLTQLTKFDGYKMRRLRAREFHQIAGRAGRSGFDTEGMVIALAPEHEIENAKMVAKAGDDPKKLRRIKKKKPPEGFVAWSEQTFTRLIEAAPETLNPRMRITHSMVLAVVSRGGDAWANVHALINSSAQPDEQKAKLNARADEIFATLIDAGVVEKHSVAHDEWSRGRGTAHNANAGESDEDAGKEPDASGASSASSASGAPGEASSASGVPGEASSASGVPGEANIDASDADTAYDYALTIDLPDDFALDQPLSPFMLAALELLDPESDTYALDVISLVEATLEDPRQVLRAQERTARDKAMAEMKADGVEYEERLERLAEVTYPRPLEDLLEAAFAHYCQAVPWARDHELAPKSVLRDMLETVSDFKTYVGRYNIARSEGTLLRYLSDAYRVLDRTIPLDARDEKLWDVIAWLGFIVRSTDSSLVDEWESAGQEPEVAMPAMADEVVRDRRGLTVLVRNALFARVRLASMERADELGRLDGAWGYGERRWREALESYFAEHEEILIDADARSSSYFVLDESPEHAEHTWHVRQIFSDEAGDHDFAIVAEVDLDATQEEGEAVFKSYRVGFIEDFLE